MECAFVTLVSIRGALRLGVGLCALPTLMMSPMVSSRSGPAMDILPAYDIVCRACGCGDNTIGHWTRWCVVPLIVAIAILQPCQLDLTMDQLACQSSRHAAVCTLVLASFRRLLRQEGAFLHQQAAAAKKVQWWISKLHENVALDAHVQLNVAFPVQGGGAGRCTWTMPWSELVGFSHLTTAPCICHLLLVLA